MSSVPECYCRADLDVGGGPRRWLRETARSLELGTPDAGVAVMWHIGLLQGS